MASTLLQLACPSLQAWHHLPMVLRCGSGLIPHLCALLQSWWMEPRCASHRQRAIVHEFGLVLDRTAHAREREEMQKHLPKDADPADVLHEQLPSAVLEGFYSFLGYINMEPCPLLCPKAGRLSCPFVWVDFAHGEWGLVAVLKNRSHRGEAICRGYDHIILI